MRWVLSALFVFAAIPLHAEQVNVAAASDLNFAIQEIIQQFELETGHNVRLTLGSSGNFYAQISNGAPFDVFLSADVSYARQLEATGRAVLGSTFIYGVGALAVWAPNNSRLNLDSLGMKALLEPSVKKIAIANPDHAPYGRAAVAAMRQAGVYDQVQKKLVLGENISQTAQFVQSGTANVGIIALSIAMSAPMRAAGSYWIIPRKYYPPLEQGAVLLKKAGPAGKSFHEWLRSAAAKKIFEKHGLTIGLNTDPQR